MSKTRKTNFRKPPAHWWDRSQVTVKLSSKRLEWMAAIALAMPAGATPQEAIDHALRKSAENQDPIDPSGMEDLRESMRRNDIDRRADFQELSSKFDRLIALITEAATHEEDY